MVLLDCIGEKRIFDFIKFTKKVSKKTIIFLPLNSREPSWWYTNQSSLWLKQKKVDLNFFI